MTAPRNTHAPPAAIISDISFIYTQKQFYIYVYVCSIYNIHKKPFNGGGRTEHQRLELRTLTDEMYYTIVVARGTQHQHVRVYMYICNIAITDYLNIFLLKKKKSFLCNES